MTLNCIASVEAHTRKGAYEIIVVDNGSAASDIERLASASPGRYRLIALNRNAYFGEANNIGVEHAAGEFIVLLNNDVTVTSNWLDPLVAVFSDEPCAGAVGPKMLYPDGRLQEAGCYVCEDGWTVQLGKFELPPFWYVDSVQPVDYCSAACLLMLKTQFLALGGFDPIYEPAYFEDSDLAFRLRSIGLFTYYCGLSTIHHYENLTSRRIWSENELNNYVNQNHDRFVARWGSYVQTRFYDDSEPRPLPAINWQPEPQASKGEQIVLYSPDALTMSDASRRLLDFACLAQGSFDVVIAADEIMSRCRIYSLCRNFGLCLRSFKVRKISALDFSHLTVVMFRDDKRGDRSFEVISERDALALLQSVDGEALQ